MPGEKEGYDPASLPDLLPIYYKKLFPYGPYCKWLQYGGVPKDYFSRREMSFTLKDDVYIRYLSFSNQQEMEQEMQKRCPYKIDIGAIFSLKPKDHKTVKAAAFQAQEKELVFDIDMTDYDDPKDHKTVKAAAFQAQEKELVFDIDMTDYDDVRSCCPFRSWSYIKPKDHKTVKAAAFQAQEKELVFDIDMTDYDDVRSCCSGAEICEKCWPLMQIAIKIIDRALRDDFGFEHLLWVYSGRRGVHCWVCDETARKLSQSGRTAIAEYLSVVKGGENQTKKIILDKQPHPSIQCAIDIVSSRFDDYGVNKQDFMGEEDKCAIDIVSSRFDDYGVNKQDFMGEEDQYKKVLQLIPDEELRNELIKQMDSLDTTKKRWLLLKKHLKAISSKNEYRKSHAAVEEIMLQYCYPRLDVNVSKGVNHLLKSPFCIHPKTGRVCVPVDPDRIDEFDPFKVPTISEIVEELNHAEPSEEGGKKVKDYNRTSMKTCMAVFDKFLSGLEKSWRGKLIEESDKKMEF